MENSINLLFSINPASKNGFKRILDKEKAVNMNLSSSFHLPIHALRHLDGGCLFPESITKANGRAEGHETIKKPAAQSVPRAEYKKKGTSVWMSLCGGDEGDRTPYLLNAIQALSRLDRLHTPLNRANRAFNTRDTPPKAAKPSAFFLKFIIAGARPHINTKFENKLDTAIPFSHGIISLFHSERGC